MQQAALLWHVSLLAEPDGKALALGLVGLVRVAPIFLFSMVAGTAADTFDRRRLMVVTQIGGTLTALSLAVLAFAGLTVLWPLYVLAAFGAAVSTFDPPARQALLPSLVPRDDLANAISLNSVMVQVASVAGPTVGGLLIALGGVAWAYVFNALSFLFVLWALLAMREVPVLPRAGEGGNGMSLAATRQGLRFVFGTPMIRSTMLLDFFATFFSSAIALLPIFAQDILHVGARGYGWLYAAPAVGAVLGSGAMLVGASRIGRQGWTLVWAVAIYGSATVVFGLSQTFWLTFMCLAVGGTADAVSTVIRSLVRQLETPDELRGRMTGINMVFFMGGPQLGELEAGLVANWLGARASVVSGGVGCLIVTALVAALTPELRRYRSARMASS